MIALRPFHLFSGLNTRFKFIIVSPIKYPSMEGLQITNRTEDRRAVQYTGRVDKSALCRYLSQLFFCNHVQSLKPN